MVKKMICKITSGFIIVFTSAAGCPVMTFASSMTTEEAEVAEAKEDAAVEDSDEDGLASDMANSETADGKTDGKEDDGEPSKFNASDFDTEDEDSGYMEVGSYTNLQTEVTADEDPLISTIIDILETPFSGDTEDASDNGILTVCPKTSDTNVERICLIVIIIACGGIIGTVIFRRSRSS